MPDGVDRSALTSYALTAPYTTVAAVAAAPRASAMVGHVRGLADAMAVLVTASAVSFAVSPMMMAAATEPIWARPANMSRASATLCTVSARSDVPSPLRPDATLAVDSCHIPPKSATISSPIGALS